MGNFMTAGTEIDGMIAKKEQCLEKIANTLAGACIERGREGKVSNNMSTDIYKLIRDLPTDDQIKILCEALTTVSSSINGNNKKPKGRSDVHADYFSRRGF